VLIDDTPDELQAVQEHGVDGIYVDRPDDLPAEMDHLSTEFTGDQP
jgi:methionine salvage enolase-phosphatase E1